MYIYRSQQFLLCCCKYFYDPLPAQQDIMDGVSVFCDAVSKRLRAGVSRQRKFTVEMPTDVLKYLFKNKGSDYEHGLGWLYTDSDWQDILSTGLVQSAW